MSGTVLVKTYDISGLPDPTDFSDPLGPIKIENMVGHDITGGGGNGSSGCCFPGCVITMLLLPVILLAGGFRWTRGAVKKRAAKEKLDERS